MPLYWRRRFYNYYKPKRWRRRRLQFRRRRPRRTFRRRGQRKQWVRRRRKYRKKLKKITVKEWQPKKIVKCKIKGDIALFICGQSRIGHNFTLYKESNVPVGEAGGGGWSIQRFSLECLYEEYIKYKNFWTKSNQGLPLARFQGVKLKLYRSPHTDYIATISNCPPFSVTRDMYFNTQPQRQLFEPKKIIVTQLKPNSRKRYKTTWVNPPSFMQSKWYFQQDICKTTLFNITTTACSMEQPYCPENQISSSITLYALNTDMFHNPDFTSNPTTEHGYVCKIVGTQKFRLFGQTDGTGHPQKWTDVIPLTTTNRYTSGAKHIDSYSAFNNPANWGNPFSAPWGHEDAPIYYHTEWPASETDYKSQSKPGNFTPLEYLYQKCRYNPDKDTGIGNIVYMKQNNHTTQGTIFDEPSNQNLIVKDYPLWMIFWAWSDWLEASKAIQDHFEGYFIVVKTKFIYPPKQAYVFLDKYFTNDHDRDLTETDRSKWHPKYGMQTDVEYNFAMTGPYAPKINRSSSIQANMNYTFHFKWGGCPAKMEHVSSPCNQDKFPIPNQEQSSLEIQDPQTDKKDYLYYWDERREQLTGRCIKRITRDQKPELSITDLCALHAPVETPQEESDQEETQKEAQTPLHQQLQQLREQQHLLRKQLLRISRSQSLK
nr:MAG: ORF1 [TTV-like mini virus]